MCKAPHLIDATRLRDSEYVVLKPVGRATNPDEEAVALLIGSPSSVLSTDPRNHSIPIYETLPVPGDEGTGILVMALGRSYRNPPWDTVGEMLDCIIQIFEVCYVRLCITPSD
jgi:hypothetical protein